MESYKKAAIRILSTANIPLHYREITTRAIEQKLITPEGKTPWATMNATISQDIIEFGEKSCFIRSDPGYYALSGQPITSSIKITVPKNNVPSTQPAAPLLKHPINDQINTKQKGDITEGRVAELITLYGKEGLSCYKPTSDHEGIDLIVKKRGEFEVVYIQVKSTFGNKKDRGFVSTVKAGAVKSDPRMIMVFVYFDLSDGDLYDHIFCIPALDFLRLTDNSKKQTGDRVFAVGLSHPEKSKFAEFMIEKRELANRILEIMAGNKLP